MTTISTTPTTRPVRSSAIFTIGAAALVGGFWIFYGAHNWLEILISMSMLALATALLLGIVLPRALRKESAGGTALTLSVLAVLVTVPAFWSGLPIVLGVAGMVVGRAGRSAQSGSGKCIAAVVLGALAVASYLAIYVLDALVAGNSGFLFD